MERIPDRDSNSKKKTGEERPGQNIRAWKAPKNEVDEAVGNFLRQTNRKGISRGEAFREVTKDLGTKDTELFLRFLSVAEKGPVSAHMSAGKSKKPERVIVDRSKITFGLRQFNQSAIEHGGDLRAVFDQVSDNLKFSADERAELAREVMGALTPADITHAAETVSDVAIHTEIGEQQISDNARLIPRDEKIEELHTAARIPEDLRELIHRKFQTRQAKIKIGEDGTAQVIGENPRYAGRRRRSRRGESV